MKIRISQDPGIEKIGSCGTAVWRKMTVMPHVVSWLSMTPASSPIDTLGDGTIGAMSFDSSVPRFHEKLYVKSKRIPEM